MHGPVDQNDAANDPLVDEAARLRVIPTFQSALREYTVAQARFRESSWVLNKLIASETRFRLTAYLFYLSAANDTGGVTYGQLYDICTSRQEISPRVLKSTLAIMKLTGMIGSHRTADRRSKVYRPTARMFALLDSWMPHAVKPLDLLQPEMQREWMWKNDPEFVRRFLLGAGREHTTGKVLIDRMPAFNAFFGKREGAVALTLVSMLAHIDGVPIPSRGDIAKRFGLSKTQVSRVFAEGARMGYFTIDGADVPSVTPHMVDSYARWASIELAFYARYMRPA